MPQHLFDVEHKARNWQR